MVGRATPCAPSWLLNGNSSFPPPPLPNPIGIPSSSPGLDRPGQMGADPTLGQMPKTSSTLKLKGVALPNDLEGHSWLVKISSPHLSTNTSFCQFLFPRIRAHPAIHPSSLIPPRSLLIPFLESHRDSVLQPRVGSARANGRRSYPGSTAKNTLNPERPEPPILPLHFAFCIQMACTPLPDSSFLIMHSAFECWLPVGEIAAHLGVNPDRRVGGH